MVIFYMKSRCKEHYLHTNSLKIIYFLDEICFLTYTNKREYLNLSELIRRTNRMHTIQVYIDDDLDQKSLDELKLLIQGLPHVTNVELNSSSPP